MMLFGGRRTVLYIHCRMFTSNIDLVPLDASGTPSHENKKCPQISPNVPWEAKLAPVENQCFTGNTEHYLNSLRGSE